MHDMLCRPVQLSVIFLAFLTAVISQPLNVNDTAGVQVYCMESDLANRGIKLICSKPTQAIHINYASVKSYSQMDYNNCSSPAGNHYLNTLTSDIADECEGKRGDCAFALQDIVVSDINYLEIDYECIQDKLITDWCAERQVQVTEEIYLQTNGYTSGLLPPSEVRCTCDIQSDEMQQFTILTYVMGLSYEWQGDCKYDWWSVSVSETGEPEVSCETQWRKEKEYSTESIVLVLHTDHNNHTDENKNYYRGGWLKIKSGSKGFQLACNQINLNTFAPPTVSGGVIIFATTQVAADTDETTAAAVVRTSTTSSTSTTTTATATNRALTHRQQSTNVYYSTEFIAGIVSGSILMLIISTLVILLAVAVCSKSASRIEDGEGFSGHNNNDSFLNSPSHTLIPQDVHTVNTDLQIETYMSAQDRNHGNRHQNHPQTSC